MIIKILLIIILIIVTIILIFNNVTSSFINNHDNMIDVNNYLNETDISDSDLHKLKTKLEKKEKNDIPLSWDINNTLESMNTIPCLDNENDVNRLSCFTAPEWWYPKDKYTSSNFRSKYYRDSVNPIYNYLGNSQDIYWDFKSVTN